ncbi:unnamed protein product [Ranitomeya imitator]|uniref:Aminotransferase class V domain-containing protein n=1 Tax=Ranitomeya imitator TaxID=111125 RepID=A0ABN9LGF7_9NEOB|nr:unnamed protein product [Ranitomeya imitator]
MTLFNSEQFRTQFPALTEAGVYLDNAATALKPHPVIEATEKVLSQHSGSVHRSHYAKAQQLTEMYESCRYQVAKTD